MDLIRNINARETDISNDWPLISGGRPSEGRHFPSSGNEFNVGVQCRPLNAGYSHAKAELLLPAKSIPKSRLVTVAGYTSS